MQLRNKKTVRLFFFKTAASASVGIEHSPYLSALLFAFHQTVLLITVIMFRSITATAAVPATHPASEILEIEAARNSIDIGTGFQHLLDPENILTINDVIQPDAPWQKEYRPTLHLGAADDVVWVRFSLQNMSTSRRTMVLNVDWPFWDLIELYVQGGDATHGGLDPIKSVDPKKNRLPFAFEFSCLADQQLTLYLRVHSTGALLLPLKIWQLEAYEQMCLVSALPGPCGSN